MRSKNNSLVATAMLVFLLGVFSLPAAAQHSGHDASAPAGRPYIDEKPYAEKLRVNEQGEIKLSGETRVGGVFLKSGKYKFQHMVEGEDHLVLFERVDWPDAQAEQALFRVKTKLEPIDKPAKRTEFHSTVSIKGERIVQKIYVQGESVKHVF